MPSTSSSVAASGSRKMSSTEKKIHHIAIHAPGNTILVNEIGHQLDLDASEIMQAANSLLKKNLVSIQQTERGMQLVGISMDEARQMGSLGGDEGMIYKQIRDSGNEGVWTKALKARTNLHQTILTRVIKSLENRQMIKSVKSVKHPTRKIYMLYNITPSEELSGGPWYTDHELDVAFINGLSQFCHHFIQQQTWPDGYSVSKQKLHPSSQAARLPTAPRILAEVKDKQVTTTELSVSNIQTLLETLVYDEKIEKVPMPGGLVDSSAHDTGIKTDDEDSEEDPEERHQHAKHANGSKKSHKSSSSRKQAKIGKASRSRSRNRDEEDDSSGSASDITSGSSSDDGGKRKKRKRSGLQKDSGRSDSKLKQSSRKLKRADSTSSSSASEENQSGDESDARRRTHDASSKRRLSKSKSSENGTLGGGHRGSSKGDSSQTKYAGPDFKSDEDDDDEEDEGAGGGLEGSSWGAHNWVYRALRPVEVPRGYSETPCARCPVSDFCRPRGPVNAEDCVYYGSYLEGAWSESEDEDL